MNDSCRFICNRIHIASYTSHFYIGGVIPDQDPYNLSTVASRCLFSLH